MPLNSICSELAQRSGRSVRGGACLVPQCPDPAADPSRERTPRTAHCASAFHRQERQM